jgi:8-oxo-dGTP diphosphatase
MSERHTIVPRTMCFVFHDDEVLLIKAGERKDWTGTHDPVGGHIEQSEDVVASAEREIKEETGLTVVDTKLRGIIHVTNFHGKNIMMFVTTSNAPHQNVVANDEGELVWIKQKDVNTLEIFADVKPILEKILSMRPGQLLHGTSTFDGGGTLVSLDLHIQELS